MAIQSDNNDSLGETLRPLFDGRLSSHLASAALSPFSRISTERLKRKALPHITSIELVDGAAFEKTYCDLYTANFHGGERERPDLIVQRLRDDFNGKRVGLQPYRIIGLRDSSGHAIGAAHFSSLLLTDGLHVVPFLQYIYVRPANRRQDLSELMHTLILAVASVDATALCGSESETRLPFTLMETEPPVHGSNEQLRAKAAERTQIHSKSGSLALMLRRSDGRILSAHVQPGLEIGEPPLTYIWALRANPALCQALKADDSLGRLAIAGYYQSLRDEGFPEENIAVAERLVDIRCGSGASFCLLELSDITKAMYVGID